MEETYDTTDVINIMFPCKLFFRICQLEGRRISLFTLIFRIDTTLLFNLFNKLCNAIILCILIQIWIIFNSFNNLYIFEFINNYPSFSAFFYNFFSNSFSFNSIVSSSSFKHVSNYFN